MALAKRLGHDHVGSSKKHDAPHPMQHPSPSRWPWSGFRRRRIILIIIAVLTVFVFVRNLPTDVVPVGQRYDPRFGPMAPGHIRTQPISDKTNAPKSPVQNYDGSIQFINLAGSLRPHLSWPTDNNVLFVLPTLSSISNLVPFACDMAKNNRSIVHVALMGRYEIGVDNILKINGISDKECPVFWHDARPDHPLESSNARIAKSLRTGFAHCCTVLRPQVAVTDAFEEEDLLISKALNSAALAAQVQVISLPKNAEQSLPWITALDGASLRRLNDIQIDIVIQAYSESAGSLIRLLRSIESANYDGLPYPRITIELPPQIDTFMTNYLTWFRWPPYLASLPNQLTLRRRISTQIPSPVQASLRMLESFYPQSTLSSHVLFLSPDAELSPNYLHYLMFTLLEYKYGATNFGHSHSLFGLSLALPDQKLDGKKPFIDGLSEKMTSMFLSQIPVHDAVLFVGDKWAEFHMFLTQRLLRDPELAIGHKSAAPVSKDHPAWLSEALSFMQARNLYTLYPSFTTTDDLRLVTLHREMHQLPEEYASTRLDEKHGNSVDEIMRNHVLSGDQEPTSANDNTAHTNPFLPMQVLTSSDGSHSGLPALYTMPLYTANGVPIEWSESLITAEAFADEFSLHQGGCASLESRDKKLLGRPEYLFCAPD